MFIIENIIDFKRKALHWASSFNVCCYLDSNNYNDPYGSYDTVIAIDSIASLQTSIGNAFEDLKSFHSVEKADIFGFLTYDLKNELEDLHSANPDHLHFPALYFFKPRIILKFKGTDLEIISNDDELRFDLLLERINNFQTEEHKDFGKINIKSRVSRENYLQKVQKVKEHIVRGDIYEMNLCQEFYAENCIIDPLQTWQRLTNISPTPFASFFKLNEQYILCASPERYLRKNGSRLISQPIKGTSRRSKDPVEDLKIKEHLYNDPKERAENVMIVDLVRNDLTRCAEPGSVKVEELFGIYGFSQVYQMISTISADLKTNLHFTEAIKDTFPMGSMTGAPKISAMKLIEQYEETMRGIYSGAIGYITANGDFDFNVVIRSLLYNAANHYLSYQVGGAITFNSIAENEYDECLLKAKAISEALQ
ncbi:anthranilate synthase component I family protein [Solitalea koreensis]|uniref:Para-aminobenzoate synthetase component 1 n=1 Tax=Solitalea koreensis TaxID=543615 RepID=A0A521DX93_9SPHI|nr:anthranilate synthase component I family protein [Solitalea koreensis]SMO76349.1 para-aminobenzoate synthetase component 1 [Solitalea koreensis]